MRILAGVADILCELSVEHAFHGRLVTLGKQSVVITPGQWTAIRDRTDFVSTRSFFRSLGFADVSSIDISSYEAGDFIHDLNAPTLPSALNERFDFVFDGSTIEPIVHMPNVLANIFRMLKVGGRVLHMAPSNHVMDDGFHQLSPTFFVDYFHDEGGRTRIDTRDHLVR